MPHNTSTTDKNVSYIGTILWEIERSYQTLKFRLENTKNINPAVAEIVYEIEQFQANLKAIEQKYNDQGKVNIITKEPEENSEDV